MRKPTKEGMESVQAQLAQIANDPNLTITCYCHTFCLKCNKFAGECKCVDQPWNKGRKFYPDGYLIRKA